AGPVPRSVTVWVAIVTASPYVPSFTSTVPVAVTLLRPPVIVAYALMPITADWFPAVTGSASVTAVPFVKLAHASSTYTVAGAVHRAGVAERLVMVRGGRRVGLVHVEGDGAGRGEATRDGEDARPGEARGYGAGAGHVPRDRPGAAEDRGAGHGRAAGDRPRD